MRKANLTGCVCEKNFTGSNCEFDMRRCSLNVCLNNGTCTDIIKNDGNNQADYDFECTCAYSYLGKSCEIKKNLCEKKPCSLKGICNVVNINQTVCKCFKGYYGDNCEFLTTELRVKKVVRLKAYRKVSIFFKFSNFYLRHKMKNTSIQLFTVL